MGHRCVTRLKLHGDSRINYRAQGKFLKGADGPDLREKLNELMHKEGKAGKNERRSTSS